MEKPTCRTIREGDAFQGRQGFTYRSGLNDSTVGARAICMTTVTLPDGARAKTHLHRGIETAVYVLEGRVEMYFGDRLRERIEAEAGEYMYVPSDVAHQVMNRSGAPCRALVAHSCGDDQEGIVLLPEMDGIVP